MYKEFERQHSLWERSQCCLVDKIYRIFPFFSLFSASQTHNLFLPPFLFHLPIFSRFPLFFFCLVSFPLLLILSTLLGVEKRQLTPIRLLCSPVYTQPLQQCKTEQDLNTMQILVSFVLLLTATMRETYHTRTFCGRRLGRVVPQSSANTRESVHSPIDVYPGCSFALALKLQ